MNLLLFNAVHKSTPRNSKKGDKHGQRQPDQDRTRTQTEGGNQRRAMSREHGALKRALCAY